MNIYTKPNLFTNDQVSLSDHIFNGLSFIGSLGTRTVKTIINNPMCSLTFILSAVARVSCSENQAIHDRSISQHNGEFINGLDRNFTSGYHHQVIYDLTPFLQASDYLNSTKGYNKTIPVTFSFDSPECEDYVLSQLFDDSESSDNSSLVYSNLDIWQSPPSAPIISIINLNQSGIFSAVGTALINHNGCVLHASIDPHSIPSIQSEIELDTETKESVNELLQDPYRCGKVSGPTIRGKNLNGEGVFLSEPHICNPVNHDGSTPLHPSRISRSILEQLDPALNESFNDYQLSISEIQKVVDDIREALCPDNLSLIHVEPMRSDLTHGVTVLKSDISKLCPNTHISDVSDQKSDYLSSTNLMFLLSSLFNGSASSNIVIVDSNPLAGYSPDTFHLEQSISVLQELGISIWTYGFDSWTSGIPGVLVSDSISEILAAAKIRRPDFINENDSTDFINPWYGLTILPIAALGIVSGVFLSKKRNKQDQDIVAIDSKVIRSDSVISENKKLLSKQTLSDNPMHSNSLEEIPLSTFAAECASLKISSEDDSFELPSAPILKSKIKPTHHMRAWWNNYESPKDWWIKDEDPEDV